MIVNLYVDHMMSAPPTSAEEVWNQTREHAKLFSDAAQRVGLTPAEYREFRTSLLDGKAVYVKLPRRLDAMAGDRRGSVYVVKNAVMTTRVMGWRVNLADGAVVYVPQTCGNISLLRPAVVAHVARPHHPKYTQAVARIPKAETPVALVPPEQAVPVEAPAVAQVAPAAVGGAPGGFLFAIPVILGGVVAGLTHGGTSHPVAPPCTNGSNTVGVCSK